MSAPSLKIGNRAIDGGNSIAAGQTVNFYIDLQNLGKGQARGISATLSTTSSYVQSYSSASHQYPDIAWDETKKNTLAFQLQTTPNYPTNGALNLNLRVEDEFGKVWDLPFNLAERPATVSGLSFTSVENNIKLSWASQSGIGGYNVYRCAADQNGNESGSYAKLNKGVLAMAYYQDDDVSSVTKYYYKVSAVSPTGNEGALSSSFPAWTSLGQKGLYPVRFNFITRFAWGVNAADANNDGYKELFAVMRDDGHIVGLDHTGKELFDTDKNVTTYSGFAETGVLTDATPAIGNIYGDGKQYLVEPTRDLDQVGTNRLICYSMEDTDGDSNPDIKWERPVASNAYRGAILANLDNSADGSLEIVVGYENNDSIRIFDANGTRLCSKGGINKRYAAMAVADLDGDGQKEIIAPGYDGIYVWHRDFTPFRANERIYTINDPDYAFVSSVVVCDLDNDGQKEILTMAVKRTSPYDAKAYAIKLDGTLLPGWGLGAQGQTVPDSQDYWPREISVGDLNRDGNLEVVLAGINVVKILNKEGLLVRQIAVDNFTPYGGAILADVDGDADAEIIVSSQTNERIHAFKMNGSEALGFPLILKQDLKHRGISAVADIDNDGKNELIVNAESSIYVFSTAGKPENIEWGMERHDQWNTGEYTKPCLSLDITSNTLWSSDKSICGNLTVYPGCTLTVNNNCHIQMGGSSIITLRAGAALMVDMATLSGVSIKALPGSSLTIKNDSHVRLRPGGECSVEAGAIGDISYGSVEMP